MKRYSLLYASFAALLRSGWEDASQSIAMLQQLNNTHFPSPVSDDATFTHLYHLLLGVQKHYTARLDAALEYYGRIPPQAGETYLLALLNQSIILRLGTPQDQKKAIMFRDEVERRLVTGNQTSPQIRVAWFLVRGITTAEVLPSQFVSPRNIR
jgi:Cohesin loading factor